MPGFLSSKKLVTVFLLSVMFSHSAQAATYYVATNGNDSRTKVQAQSISTPWKTISKAATIVAAGDTVYVRGGVYNENIGLNGKQGSASAWIKFLNYRGEKPKIRGNTWGTFWLRAGSSYIEINGFEITNSFKDGAGIRGHEKTHHIRGLNNRIHHCGGEGITFQQSDYITITGNRVYNNSYYCSYHTSGISMWNNTWWSDKSPGNHFIISNNIVFGNKEINTGSTHTDGNGIIIDESPNGPPTLISGNSIYNNGGRGINIYKSSNVTVKKNKVHNNQKDHTVTNSGELTAFGTNEVKTNNVSFINNTVQADSGKIALYIERNTTHNVNYSGNTIKSGLVVDR